MDEAFIRQLRKNSREIAPEYPGIHTNLEPCEHLWAIVESCKGLYAANEDMHKFTNFLISQLGWTAEEAVKKFEEQNV